MCYWWLLVGRVNLFHQHVLSGYPSHGPHTCQSEHRRRFIVEEKTRLRRVAGRISLHIAVRVRILLGKVCCFVCQALSDQMVSLTLFPWVNMKLASIPIF
jgi:hypothetical protein